MKRVATRVEKLEHAMQARTESEPEPLTDEKRRVLLEKLLCAAEHGAAQEHQSGRFTPKQRLELLNALIARAA